MSGIPLPAESTPASNDTAAFSPSAARALLTLVIAASAATGFLAAGMHASLEASAHAGDDLTHLLRAMALLKSVMAAGAAGAVLWRFGSPVSVAWWAAYTLACAGMAAGPGLIWQMAYVGTGALLLHGGLLATLLLLWRDPAVGARLGMMVAARRAALQGR